MIDKTYPGGFTVSDLQQLLRDNISKIDQDTRLMLQHAITLVGKSSWSRWNNTMIEMLDKSMTPVVTVRSGSCANHVCIHFDGGDRPADYYKRKGWGYWLYERVITAWDKIVDTAMRGAVGALTGKVVIAAIDYKKK